MNGKDSVLFSKKSDEWETPRDLFELLNKEFHFRVDGACTPNNCLCDKGFMYNALNVDWVDVIRGELRRPPIVYLNPPYSAIGKFMKKAYEESLKGAIVVCLIPCRTDTRYWHEYVMKAHEIRFIMGRLRFENRSLPTWNAEGNFKISSAPFPSCIVIFDHSKYDKNNDPIMKAMRIPKTQTEADK